MSAENEHEEKFTIVVNAQRKTVMEKELSFAQVVALAFPTPGGPNTIYTVTYRKGPHENPEGTLVEGQSVQLKDGMVFNVAATDKS